MLTTNISKDRFEHLKKLQQAVKDAQSDFFNFRQNCRVEAPAKVGDVIKVDGYVYDKQKMKVIVIELHSDYTGEFYWKAHGEVLNKNGKPGQRRATTTWKVKPC